MKKLILAITVAAFTIGAYANDSASKEKSACTGKAACADKAATSCCSATKSQCTASTATTKQDAAKKVVHSPKGEQNSKS